MVNSNVEGRALTTNDAAGYDSIIFQEASNPRRVVPLGTETNSVAIRILNSNSGTVYVGFDDKVSQNDGFPLLSGESLNIDLDTNQQSLFVVGDTVGDEVRWIATS